MENVVRSKTSWEWENEFPDYCIAGAIYRASLTTKNTGCPGYGSCYVGDVCKNRKEGESEAGSL